MRRAAPGDVDIVLALHGEASEWLASRGSDQWQPDSVGKKTKDRVRQSIETTVTEQTCWLAYINGNVVGTITVDSHADPEFWNADDLPSDALYVHRMIVRRNSAGRGLGKVLLEVAEHLARTAGRRWVRLDAWSTNQELQEYYLRMGFVRVRTLHFSHRGSGALFQRAVRNTPSLYKTSWTSDSIAGMS